ncbi:hypothetical protein DRJ25_03650 [Candidatus Woesearchaeota archaeon]|nr:MAG: hypothetical protein DRJ25_03650 [Candidatus Woesearchaeota archaeon]
MYEKIFSLLVEKDEISWKSMILDLIRKEGLDPWDVDVSLLAQKYIERLKKMKEQNLKVSGKVVLAASILLRLKSNKLIGDDLDEFDRLIAGSEVSEEEFYDELSNELAQGEEVPKEKLDFRLLPRLPQPRKRKVSVFDLVKALEKALEVKQRRILRNTRPHVAPPEKGFDIGEAIVELSQRIDRLIAVKGQLKFVDLLVEKSRKDIVLTFLPLLHLSNDGKVNLKQEVHFGDIFITKGGVNNAD